MVVFETEVMDVIQRTHDVKSFRFSVKQSIDFKPGQFFFVGIKIGAQERTKHFSFSNSPTEKGYVEFTKRITDSEFSKALDKLEAGSWARVKMPYGSFTFEGEYEKISLLSGGIGITPIRSICRFVADKKLKTDIVLLYGNNTEKDIIFREDFDRMKSDHRSIRVVYTLTSPDAGKGGWQGRVGFIDREMIQEEIPDLEERIFYVCGPPGMVHNLTGILREQLSVEEDRIKTENFSGYT
jgi:ferredoxin-NADP reductase